MSPALRLSMFTETDVEQAAHRIVDLSRRRLDRIVDYQSSHDDLAGNNPYILLFVWLFRYARGDSTEEASVARQLDVADAVLANPLYAGPEGAVEAPLLLLVASGARARLKLRQGESVSEHERSLLED